MFFTTPLNSKLCKICINQSSCLDLENGGSHNRVRGLGTTKVYHPCAWIDTVNASLESPTSTLRETTRSPAQRFAARRSLGLLASRHQTAWWSLRTSSHQHGPLLISFTSGCHLFCWILLSFRTGGLPYSPGFVSVWCLPEQESLGAMSHHSVLVPCSLACPSQAAPPLLRSGGQPCAVSVSLDRVFAWTPVSRERRTAIRSWFLSLLGAASSSVSRDLSLGIVIIRCALSRLRAACASFSTPVSDWRVRFALVTRKVNIHVRMSEPAWKKDKNLFNLRSFRGQTAYAVSSLLPSNTKGSRSFSEWAFARTVARMPVNLEVWRRDTHAADKMPTRAQTQRQDSAAL